MELDGIHEESQVRCEARLYKRPIITFNKEFNDIFITNKVPLCVYHKRAVDLLQWQLSDFTRAASTEILNTYNVNPKTGQLRNKSRLSINFNKDVAMEDSKDIMCTLTKRHVNSNNLLRRGVNIYAAGSCIKKAFYLLQDIYDYLGSLYVEGKCRFSGNLSIYCKDCKLKLKSETPKRSRDLVNDCKMCKVELNKRLEVIIKKLIDIEITSGSISCTDEIWKFQSNAYNNSSTNLSKLK